VLSGHERTLERSIHKSLAEPPGRAPYSLQQNRLSDSSTNKETLVTDVWTNDGIQYTIDAKVGVGGVITAQRKDAKTTHSRIVPKLVTREETEKLFEDDV
jgi:hypothetical protein